MVNEIFVNLAVKDLKKSMAFFKKLGFKFNPEFTDKKAACMIMGKNIYSMLLLEKFFKTFIKKNLVDAKKSTEVLTAISLNSKKEVDDMVKNAIKAGGREPRPISDYGWMYSRSFEDLDGHIWEPFYIDKKKKPKK